jgi:hypothetical protein
MQMTKRKLQITSSKLQTVFKLRISRGKSSSMAIPLWKFGFEIRNFLETWCLEHGSFPALYNKPMTNEI